MSLTNIHGTCAGNTVDSFKEGRCIGCEDTNPSVAVLLNVIRQRSRTTGELAVGAPQHLAFQVNMMNCRCLTRLSARRTGSVGKEIHIGFNSCCPREKLRGGQAVQMDRERGCHGVVD